MNAIAMSAPASLMASRCASPRLDPIPVLRNAISQPTSPRGSRRAARVSKDSSYSTLKPFIPTPAAGSFGKQPREILLAERGAGLSNVHSYGELKSTLKRSGSCAFGKATRELSLTKTVSAAVPFHANPSSTLKQSGASCFGRAARPTDPSLLQKDSLAPVHSYASTPRLSSFAQTKHGTFAKAGRPSYTREGETAPVHSYGGVGSTLKTAGARTWGVAQWGPRPLLATPPAPRPGSAVKMVSELRMQTAAAA